MQLGRLSSISVTEIWKSEPQDFTPWLLSNVEQLSEELGLELELQQSEYPVGSFRLDLFGVISGTQDRVIIENQLTPSDHSHLGQVLTYAGGTEARYVIWIASKFRPEHLSAIDWLNAGTTEEINFFAVEVSAVKIGDSLPAPLFKVLAQPNEWTKETKAKATAAIQGERGQRQAAFWNLFLERLKEKAPRSTNAKKGMAQSWLAIGAGVKGVSFSFVITGSEMRVNLAFDSSNRNLNEARFQQLKTNAGAIEEKFGDQLNWYHPPNNISALLRHSSPANFDSDSLWDTYIDWMIASFMKLREAVLEDLGNLRDN